MPDKHRSHSTETTLKIDKKTGRLEAAKWIASPNFDELQPDLVPELIVIHGISLPPNQFGGRGVEQLFTNQLNPDEDPFYAQIAELKVSAHLFIRRDGEIIQFVSFKNRAWHAGVSCFQGREKCNDFSIGIELEGADHIPYNLSQYKALAEVIKALSQTYPSLQPDLVAEKIVGHSQIAPGRKTDPGPLFAWGFLTDLLQDKS